jgi:hypothetical protein
MGAPILLPECGKSAIKQWLHCERNFTKAPMKTVISQL